LQSATENICISPERDPHCATGGNRYFNGASNWLLQGEGCRLEFSGFSPFKSRMMNHTESPKPRAFVKIDGKTKMAQLRQQSLEVMARLKEGVEAATQRCNAALARLKQHEATPPNGSATSASATARFYPKCTRQ
ncbi:MAG TPA: hypothetical protein VFO40_03475, partial [Chthoniobacterales bacterium]|nr:hypothetical protein [Chthoniobacterales bacterium]